MVNEKWILVENRYVVVSYDWLLTENTRIVLEERKKYLDKLRDPYWIAPILYCNRKSGTYSEVPNYTVRKE